MVLNKRIKAHLEDTQQLHDGQQGFRPGRSAVGNIYMLKTCLDARCQQKLDTYLLFVDLKIGGGRRGDAPGHPGGTLWGTSWFAPFPAQCYVSAINR
jgi:hypothetical protein